MALWTRPTDASVSGGLDPAESRAAAQPAAVAIHVTLVFLLAAEAAMFFPALKGYWLADDFTWAREFFLYPWREIPRLFMGDWSRSIAQEYRPLWCISFVTDLTLWGASPLALHVTSLLIHLAVCALLWCVAASVPGANRFAAPLALAFFVVMPNHAEPVAWISARGHVLVCVFILGAMVLLRRFQQRGGRLSYLGSLGCAVAAFATAETAVALPPLLLLRDIADAPRLDRRWPRTALAHVPFWALLAGYLGFRYAMFGMLTRSITPTSLPTLIQNGYQPFLGIWSSVLGGFGGSRTGTALHVLVPALLLIPFFIPAEGSLRRFARGLIFFAVLWPLVSTVVLLGARAPRHLYLAWIGMAIALGLAGSRLLASRRRVAWAGVAAIGLVLGLFGLGLRSRIALFERNGRLSRELDREVERAMERAAPDPRALLVIIPEFPGQAVHFWEYFYPDALNPPFRRSPPTVKILPSFASCDCGPAEWKASNTEALALLEDERASAIHLVLWDSQNSAFVTRVLSPSDFWAMGYASHDGALVRPRRPGTPEPTLRPANGSG